VKIRDFQLKNHFYPFIAVLTWPVPAVLLSVTRLEHDFEPRRETWGRPISESTDYSSMISDHRLGTVTEAILSEIFVQLILLTTIRYLGAKANKAQHLRRGEHLTRRIGNQGNGRKDVKAKGQGRRRQTKMVEGKQE
jgi:hypothetical protein